jgi:hypothetical protein
MSYFISHRTTTTNTVILLHIIIYFIIVQFLSIPFALSFSTYSDSEKDDLRAFLVLLANATYGTFNDVFENNQIQPKDYLSVLNSLRSDISYEVSNSHLEIFSPYSLLSTITELGSCYSYNGEIALYNSYEWVNIKKIKDAYKTCFRVV